MLQDHTKMFMKCMDMYQTKDSNQEQQGFKTMDDVANGIEHYKHYSGVHLMIEKSRFARYQQYGYQFHEKCSFHVSFGYEWNGITLKTKILIWCILVLSKAKLQKMGI